MDDAVNIQNATKLTVYFKMVNYILYEFYFGQSIILGRCVHECEKYTPITPISIPGWENQSIGS